jgi:hypothetical protein
VSEPEFVRLLADLRARCEYMLRQGLSPDQVTGLGAELEAHRDELIHLYVNPRMWEKP